MTTGANSTIDGDGVGIERAATATELSITINGGITSDLATASMRRTSPTARLHVTTAEGSTTNSQQAGMLLKHYGSGAMTVTARRFHQPDDAGLRQL
ncbi:MAG: hypothetical protein R3D01_05370 [Hyphomicrobiales bacterium]